MEPIFNLNIPTRNEIDLDDMYSELRIDEVVINNYLMELQDLNRKYNQLTNLIKVVNKYGITKSVEALTGLTNDVSIAQISLEAEENKKSIVNSVKVIKGNVLKAMRNMYNKVRNIRKWLKDNLEDIINNGSKISIKSKVKSYKSKPPKEIELVVKALIQGANDNIKPLIDFTNKYNTDNTKYTNITPPKDILAYAKFCLKSFKVIEETEAKATTNLAVELHVAHMNNQIQLEAGAYAVAIWKVQGVVTKVIDSFVNFVKIVKIGE